MSRKFHRNLIKAILALSMMFIASGYAQGVHMWYDNIAWRNQLNNSIKDFFGDHVGTYVGYGLTQEHLTPQEAVKISNQFLVEFNGIPELSEKVLDGYHLYAFAKPQDAAIQAAVIVPDHDTSSVLAAALIHYSCGHIAKKEIFDAAAVEKNYSNACTQRPTLTIFFKTPKDKNQNFINQFLLWVRSRLSAFRFNVVILNGYPHRDQGRL